MYVLVRSLWLTATLPLLIVAQRCAAWIVFPAINTSPGPAGGGLEKGNVQPAARGTNPRYSFSQTIPTSRREHSTPLRAQSPEAEREVEPLSVMDSPSAGGEAADGKNVVSATSATQVTARLHKPVGLMLAETEPGKPGLIVDELVEGGSAEVRRMVCLGLG